MPLALIHHTHVCACMHVLYRSLFLFKNKDLAGNDGTEAHIREDPESKSSDDSSEEEYQPLLTKSWTSNKAYYYGIST